MRPPDDLNTLKSLPLAMVVGGTLVVPLMWAIVLDSGTLTALAPASGLLFLAAGLYLKYRATYSPTEAFWSIPLALIFFGSFLVGCATGVTWRLHRPDLHGLAIGSSLALTIGSIAIGFARERRRLRVQRDGVPIALAELVDLQRHHIRPAPAAGASPRMGTVAFLSAVGLNLPLLLQLGGWDRGAVVWLVLPLLGGAVSYVLATAIGPGLARAVALRALEVRTGQRFTTSRIDELQALRRTFRLSPWLCRPSASTASAPGRSAPPQAAAPSGSARKRGL
ncbi:hypothetical protein OOT46_24165 [Aquabacterium sp. A7-Y]|uniref:hypothetical protein n=1 Tax=Aquabacterium sp. A7-Y TaxID=1349605 RepID=UPI00223DA5AD|nr:hypothetical protein [Aquabacterium sp. A7-Y]MCW7540921.1 hypothetical protein [Aquabacterium sp. A7-Y]